MGFRGAVFRTIQGASQACKEQHRRRMRLPQERGDSRRAKLCSGFPRMEQSRRARSLDKVFPPDSAQPALVCHRHKAGTLWAFDVSHQHGITPVPIFWKAITFRQQNADFASSGKYFAIKLNDFEVARRGTRCLRLRSGGEEKQRQRPCNQHESHLTAVAVFPGQCLVCRLVGKVAHSTGRCDNNPKLRLALRRDSHTTFESHAIACAWSTRSSL